jgi:CcmD family protein
MISLLQAMTANNTDSLMLRDGKIYLVMTVVSIILVGLFIYVASIDKKISRLEQETKN